MRVADNGVVIGRGIGAVLAVALLAIGCGQPLPTMSVPSASVPSTSWLPAVGNAANLLFSCGSGHTFTAALFDGPADAEALNNPVGDALRSFLRGAPPEYHFPARGWFLTGVDAETATLVTRGSDGELLTVGLEHRTGRWEVDNYGACNAHVVLNGLSNGDWILDPDAPAPAPNDTQFVALVTERECASGQSSAGRLVLLTILYETNRILVIFGVHPPPGAVQTCQSNPPTAVVVHLDQPIGDRRLLDGGTYPPHDASKPLP